MATGTAARSIGAALVPVAPSGCLCECVCVFRCVSSGLKTFAPEAEPDETHRLEKTAPPEMKKKKTPPTTYEPPTVKEPASKQTIGPSPAWPGPAQVSHTS